MSGQDALAKQLEAALDRKFEEKFAVTARTIAGLEEDLARAQATIQVLSHKAGVGPPREPGIEGDPAEGAHQPDQVWACMKCRSRLGLYDPEADVIRIRYKDHQIYSRVGVGGYIRVICKSCGEVNLMDYAPPADMGAIPVEDGIATLSTALLEELLERATEGGGSVVVRLGAPG